MHTTSLWRAQASHDFRFAKLSGTVKCEVVVIGGGITGITLSWLLAGQGRNVLLLEAHALGGGSTSHSTGNLYQSMGGDGVQALLQRWGKDVAQHALEKRGQAIDFIEQHALSAPGASFQRCSQLLYA